MLEQMEAKVLEGFKACVHFLETGLRTAVLKTLKQQLDGEADVVS